ncbi:MAG: hypothetical protein ACRD4O_03390 [Bryobacteraceae bacterium]
MITYTLTEWATRPFSRTWTNIVDGDFADPQLASQGAYDLLCYDRNAGSGAIFATVSNGNLNNGAPVQNGPVQVGGALTFDHRWSQIVAGPFGKSGAQLLFYDASTGTGEFFGLDASGNLHLINRNTGWLTSWTQIIAGKFTSDDGLQLLFYDAEAGIGDFWSVDNNASVHRVRTNTGWRNSWYSIIRGKFSDNKFDDLLFYDKSAGTGEFWHPDGSGGVELFSSQTDWRASWHGVKAGAFALGSKYDGLLFYEDGTGYTEFYATDGKGGISRLSVDLGALWPSKAAHWRNVFAGNFIGTALGGLSDLVAYDPDPVIVNAPPTLKKEERRIIHPIPFQGSISYFQLLPHA